MCNSKSILLSLTLLLFISTLGFSSEVSDDHGGKDKCYTEQIKTKLQDVDFKEIKDELTVMMKFTINDQNELLVLSTDVPQFDKEIKYKLNYLELEHHGLQSEKIYILPLTFKGE